jgi:hypothetical protein
MPTPKTKQKGGVKEGVPIPSPILVSCFLHFLPDKTNAQHLADHARPSHRYRTAQNIFVERRRMFQAQRGDHETCGKQHESQVREQAAKRREKKNARRVTSAMDSRNELQAQQRQTILEEGRMGRKGGGRKAQE